ncbi:MAG: hypothetical protein QME66_06830 [Candidatus Eisenbacteria bacterium]|nr:hypothetical protein [Candidatus Eisenbacteria bacterium]
MRNKFLAFLLVLVVAFISILAEVAGAGWPPCDGKVRAEVAGTTIIVYHDQAEWNCCATIVFDLVQAQDTLNVCEFETFTVGPCHCICCFDLVTRIENVAPGTYLVRVVNGETGELFGELWVTVEGLPQGQSSLRSREQSPCGGWNTGVEPQTNPTWSRIKALYR